MLPLEPACSLHKPEVPATSHPMMSGHAKVVSFTNQQAMKSDALTSSAGHAAASNKVRGDSRKTCSLNSWNSKRGHSDTTEDVQDTGSKRQKLECPKDSFETRPCAVPRHPRKPLQPLHISNDGPVLHRKVEFAMPSVEPASTGFSSIQRLVAHVVTRQAEQAAAQHQSKLQGSKLNGHNRKHDPKECQSPGQPVAILEAPVTPLLSRIKKEAVELDSTLQDEDAALLAASEGLLSMKEASQQHQLRENRGLPPRHILENFVDNDVAKRIPASDSSVKVKKKNWSWSYVDGRAEADQIPSWGAQGGRSGILASASQKSQAEVGQEKEGKIRNQGSTLQDKEKTIAILTQKARNERRRLNRRIGHLEADMAQRQEIEAQKILELEGYKAEVKAHKEKVQEQLNVIKKLQQELEELRSKATSVSELDLVQEELSRAQMEAKEASNYRQELLKYKAEAAQYQKEADKHAANVRSLQRANRANVKETDELLLKVAEMAEQVQQVGILKDRTHRMHKILTGITHRAEELRSSGREHDMEAFYTLRDIVSESLKLCESIAGKDADASTDSTVPHEPEHHEGKRARKGWETAEAENKHAEQTAQAEKLSLLEKENDHLSLQCKQQSEHVQLLEHRLAELLAAQSNPAWKARVAGGQPGEYHTFTMCKNAQVELPEGTLLSVPKSANMQSSSGSLLTLYHDGDLLNFLNVDLDSLSLDDREGAGRLLLNMDMSQLNRTEVSVLLRRLGRINLNGVNSQDVQRLTTKLLNVLGMQASMSILEDMVNNAPIPPTPSRPSAPTGTTRESEDALTYLSTTRHPPFPSPITTIPPKPSPAHTPTTTLSSQRDLNSSPHSNADPRPLHPLSPRSSFPPPSHISTVPEVEIIKSIPPPLQSRQPTPTNHTYANAWGSQDRQASPISSRPLEFSAAALAAAAANVAQPNQPNKPLLHRVPSLGQTAHLVPDSHLTSQRERDFAPPTTQRERDFSPQTTQRERNFAPQTIQRERNFAPQTTQRDRDFSPQTTQRDRDFSPQTSQRDRDFSPQTTLRGRDYSPQATQRERDYAPQTLREREFLPQTAQRDRDFAPQATQRDFTHQTTQREREFAASQAAVRDRDFAPKTSLNERASPASHRERELTPQTSQSLRPAGIQLSLSEGLLSGHEAAGVRVHNLAGLGHVLGGVDMGQGGSVIRAQLALTGNSGGQRLVLNTVGGPHGQVNVLGGDRRGGPTVVSIPLERLSSLAQLGNMPMALVQGLSHLIPRADNARR